MKDCPQCEDIPELVTEDNGYYVKCPFCGFSTKPFTTEFSAVESWDEVCEIIDMRSDVMAQTLAKETETDAKNYLNYASLSQLQQYLQLGHNNKRSWKEITGGLMLQIKVTELSYARLKRKIDAFRADSVGE